MSLLLRCSLSFLLLSSAVFADKIPVGLLGDWSLDLDSKEPSWLRMVEDEKQGPLAYLRVYVGPKGPFVITEIKDGKIHFVRRSNKKNGETLSGVVVNLSGDNVTINTDLSDPNQRVNVDRKTVESIEPSKVSMMPPNLLMMLKEEEILDLVAYILSGGDEDHAAFKK